MISHGCDRLQDMQTFLNITMSLDGFVAGPNQTLEQPLGEGGENLHEWIVGLESWRRQHGLEGGEATADGELVRETQERTGAFVMGRRMFSSGEGPLEDDPKANGWWHDDVYVRRRRRGCDSTGSGSRRRPGRSGQRRRKRRAAGTERRLT